MNSLARLGKVDVRKDEEQNIKLTEIYKLLFQAGYFRARIKGIPPFDKIVGGMTWCIELCAFDIDVDLLFHDGLAIGQKIALTEKIVHVMKYMKCPHQLEPHQIQGLDSIHIHPVIVWLVNLAANTRHEYEEETRAISVAEFKRQYASYLKMASREDDFKQTETVRHVKAKYSADFESAELRREADSKVVMREARDYAVISTDEENYVTEISEKSEAESAETTVEKLSRDVNKAMEKLILRKSGLRDMQSREAKLEETVADSSSTYEQLLDEKRQSEFAKICHDGELTEVVDLFEENKSIRSKMATFKETCYSQLEQMKTEIQSFKDNLDQPINEIDPSLIKSHAEEIEKQTVLESRLADVSYKLERIKIQMDDTPGRAELAQYQKRLTELYSQVQTVHQETQQFYNLYNTLADSKVYMEREFQLMDSINSNVQNLSGEALKRSQLFTQLSVSRNNIEENKKKLEEKLQSAQLNREDVAKELNGLQELKHRYGLMLRAVDKALLENAQLHRVFQ